MRPAATIDASPRARRRILALSAWLLAAAPAAAQQPATPNPAQATGPELTTRYRFFERYAVAGEQAPPGALGAYKVAVLDQRNTTTEQAGFEPFKSEDKFFATFVERASGVYGLDDRYVTDVVRRYEKVVLVDSRMGPGVPAPNPPLLTGMTLWVRSGPTKKVFYNLPGTEPRGLRYYEYLLIQDQLFTPAVVSILPSEECRVGDTWKLIPSGIMTLLGGKPIESGSLEGKFVEVRTDPKGASRSAIFDITGTTKYLKNSTSLHALVTFTFGPPEANQDATKKAAETVIEARGAITRINLSQVESGPIPVEDPKKTARFTTNRIFQFQRDLRVDNPPSIPAPAPQPTEANSWLTYADRDGRFQFRFPQDFQFIPRPNQFDLQRGSAEEGEDVIRIFPKERSDPNSEPEAMRKGRTADLEEDFEVTPGNGGFLPEADWVRPSRLRVYRWDAFIRPKDKTAPQKNALLLGYTVLTSRDQSFYVEALSNREPLLPIRGEVESILHTFEVDPPKK